MKRGIIIGIILAIIGAASAASFIFFWNKPTKYNAQAAKYDAISQKIEASGDIKGETSTTYYAEVTAPVSEYNLLVGDVVNGNELVLKYDLEDLEKSLEQAILSAESSENSMNGQIAASDKKASLYNKASEDSETYKELYALARASYNQLDQSQYQENWDIKSTASSVERGVAEKKTDIANKEIQVSQLKEALARSNEELAAIGDYMALLDPTEEDYEEKNDALLARKYVVDQQIAEINTAMAGVGTAIAADNRDMASLGVAAASLPNAALNPEEYSREVASSNWMEDITRNWTQSNTTKNAYEAQILNSYQKEQLQNAYDLSELNVIYAEDNINKALRGVTNEYNGIVTESYIKKGSIVSKGSPLFTVESSDNLKVELGISKYDIGDIAVGQRAVIDIAGREYEGNVSQIKRLAKVTDSDKAKVDVSVHINNPDEYVYLGLEADVTIFASEIAMTIVIPSDAYYSDDAGDYCYLIRDNVIEKRYITAGVESDDYIEVLKGINVGDLVITDSITDDAIGRKAVTK